MPEFKDKKLGKKLKELKKEAQERDARRRAQKENLPYINPSSVTINLDVLKIITEEKAREAKVAAIDSKRNEVALVIESSENPKAQIIIKELEKNGNKPHLFITSTRNLEKIWERYKEIKATPEAEALSLVSIEDYEFFQKLTLEELPKHIKKIEKEESITNMLDFVLGAAIGVGASDIHLETTKKEVLLRYRIDGILYDVYKLTQESYNFILNIIKLLSGLKINITNVPQDGRFTSKFGDVDIEIRTSVIPAEFGETVVMRVLDPKTISLTLSKLGLRRDDEEVVKKELHRPNGMVLVTGPTGSGKTTSLYAFLKAVRSPEVKVITIEDPIEYHLEGVEQTQVDQDGGYTFDSGLRSILRQDPDIILVGEIRDLDTAEIAMHSALTGHLVFSTLHTNDAAGAIPRLVDLGTNPSTIGPAVNLIIAQRLIRKLCENCKTPVEIPTEKKSKLEKFLSELPKEIQKTYKKKKVELYSSKECDKCRKGFKGRMGIFELLKSTNELDTHIVEEVTEEEIRKLAKKQGLVEMQSDGVLKALDGLTTLKEVERVTGPIEWLE